MDQFEKIDLFDEGLDTESAAPAEEVSSQEAAEAVPAAEPVAAEEPVPDAPVEAEPAPEEAAAPADEADEAEAEPAAEPAADTAPDMTAELSAKIDELRADNAALSAQLAQLAQLFEKRILYAAHEEKVIDNMHSELSKYKEDMYAQLVRPILMDVIEVRDSIIRVGETFAEKPEGERDVPLKTFSDYAYDMQDILEKNRVEIYRSQAGDDYVPIRHRVIKKIPTGDESLNGKIAQSFTGGYNYNGRTISAEKVAVYIYDASLKIQETSEVIENG